MSQISERIRHKRRDLKLTQRELAKLAGISQPLIAQIERGRILATSRIAKIAKALQVEVSFLTDEELPPEKQKDNPPPAKKTNISVNCIEQIVALLERMDATGQEKILCTTKEVFEMRQMIKKMEWVENAQMHLCLKAINNLSINGRDIDLDLTGYQIFESGRSPQKQKDAQ